MRPSQAEVAALQKLQALRPVSIILYMHVKEFSRKSNTGNLLRCAAPHLTTDVFIAGFPWMHTCFCFGGWVGG